MKRAASDHEVDISSPAAKKTCIQEAKNGMPPEPTTPIDDDMDDLYADSPAVVGRQEISSTPPTAYSAPQSPAPNPQYNYVPLPGLGLSTRQWLNSEQDVNGHEKALFVGGRPEVTPNGGLQTAEPVRSLSQPADTRMPIPSKSDQHLPGEQEEQDMQDGSIGVKAIQKETPTRKHEDPGFAPLPQGEVFSATQPDTGHSTMDDTVAQNPDPELLSNMQAYEQPSHQAISKTAQDTKEGETSQNTNDVVASSNDMDISDPPQSEQARDIEVPGAKENPEYEGPPVSSGQIEGTVGIGDKPKATFECPAGISEPNRAEDTEDMEVFGDAGDKSKPVSKATKRVPAPYQPEQYNDIEAPVTEPDQTFDKIAQANKTDDAAEFELDSSPYQSSSESESDSDSSSSSSGESHYEMLDPEEEARRLMQEDGGSDEEGKPGKATAGPLRTLNEKPDEAVPKPQIEVTPAMVISELGNVEHVVENSILLKAKTSGESRALESGSLLCLGDRSVIGVIAETLGQVQQPYYSVRFTNSACIAEAGISKGTPIFYVEQHSTYVFTQNLRALKGSDASNIHDEEVGDDELEFSDDEAEAEYKRRMKQERQARKGGRGGREDGFSKGPRGGRMGRGGQVHQSDKRNIEPPPINYDDDDGEELYTPLARPTNLHEIMGHGEAPQEDLSSRVNRTPGGHGSQQGRPDRGRGREDRGRGSRGGRGNRGRGDRRGGGGFNRDSRNQYYDNHQQQHQTDALPPPIQVNQYPAFPAEDKEYQHPPPLPSWPIQYPSNQPTPSYYDQFQNHQQQIYPAYNPYAQAHSPQQYQYPIPQTPSTQSYQYPPHQASSPTNFIPPNLPPGAHINPAFFSSTVPQPQIPQPWQQQQGYNTTPQTGESRSPEGEEAFKAAQDRLNLLRQLSRGGSDGSPS
ncbi:MAG: hypothetical protein Q9181_004645 [Wetmoreana brouardii]